MLASILFDGETGGCPDPKGSLSYIDRLFIKLRGNKEIDNGGNAYIPKETDGSQQSPSRVIQL
jgi:hypothetical protein